jgi:pimeloyl-ACP methyl ester carboxylesterase
MNAPNLSAKARLAMVFFAVLLIGVRVTAVETFVLVHGALAGGYSFKKLEGLLRAEGHQVWRPTLTGLGERVHLASRDIDLETHIQDIVNVLLWEDLHDVVLVGRSYGGMVITGVTDRIPDRIKRVVYLDAFLPQDGESLLDISWTQVPVEEDGFIRPAVLKRVSKSPPHLVAQPGKTFTQKISLHNQAAAGRIPTAYILTVDAGKKPENDDFFRYAERARARGWTVLTMEADHNPELSRPQELARLLTHP